MKPGKKLEAGPLRIAVDLFDFAEHVDKLLQFALKHHVTVMVTRDGKPYGEFQPVMRSRKP